MPSGISLHTGLNAVDPKQYSGWSGELVGCEIRRQGYASHSEKTWVRYQAATDQKRNAQQNSGRSDEGREKTEEKRYFSSTATGRTKVLAARSHPLALFEAKRGSPPQKVTPVRVAFALMHAANAPGSRRSKARAVAKQTCARRAFRFRITLSSPGIDSHACASRSTVASATLNNVSAYPSQKYTYV
jgi:hypothetical protein